MSKTAKLHIMERIERSKLEAELKIIEKEHKNELKMHNSEVQRFKAKFSKICSNSDSCIEASDIRMYQTHNPGFCYKRNGAHKMSPTVSSTQPINFKQLKSLLFTSNELDTEKFLCLHLLSNHRAESFTTPSAKILKNTPKGNIPLERLIQKSKRSYKDKKFLAEVSDLLPTYIIDIDQSYSTTNIETIEESQNGEQQIFSDSRLSSRLIVNEKLQKLIESSLVALKKSKSEKYDQIVENSRNITYLKKIFNKSSIQEFLKMLGSYSLITCSESYCLTPKLKQFPVHLEIRTIFGHLEAIILQIRKYLLQIPTEVKNEWKSLYEFDTTLLEDDLNSLISQQTVLDGLRSIRSTRAIAPKHQKSDINFDFRKNNSKNFILGNIRAVKSLNKTRSIFEGFEQDNLSVTSFRPDFPNKILTRNYFNPNAKLYGDQSNFKIEEKREYENVKKEGEPHANEQNEGLLHDTSASSNPIHIKRSNCCACQEKWKEPLPSPKIPNYKKPTLSLELYENCSSLNHLNRLHSKISEELYQLDSYDERYSPYNTNVKVKLTKEISSLGIPEKEMPVMADSVEISEYDLARIGHEIADKETDKKLRAFLRKTL